MFGSLDIMDATQVSDDDSQEYCMKLRLTIFLLSLLASAFSFSATLSQLLEEAMARTPEALALSSRDDIIQAQREAAARWFPDTPEISVSGLTDQWQSDTGQQEWRTEISSPLWNRGQRDQKIRAVDVSHEQWEAEKLALRLNVAGELREAVWRVVEARAVVRVAEQRVDNAEHLERDVARRVTVGELARADLLLAQSDTLAARNLLDDGQQQLIEARQMLHVLTGQDMLPTDPKEKKPAAVDVEAALKNHPLILAALQSSAAARSDLGIVRKSHAPPVAALSMARERDSYDEEHRTTMELALTLPIGAESRQRTAVAEANTLLTRAESELQKVRREVSQQIITAQAALAIAERQRNQAEQRSAMAQQNLALSRRSFNAGELDLLSLLRLQTSTLDALESQELKAIGFQRAITRLNQALGIFP